jgi:hypothetical protein
LDVLHKNPLAVNARRADAWRAASAACRSASRARTKLKTFVARSTSWTPKGASVGSGAHPGAQRLTRWPRRDGRIDADEVEQIFKQLGHKCKRVRAR